MDRVHHPALLVVILLAGGAARAAEAGARCATEPGPTPEGSPRSLVVRGTRLRWTETHAVYRNRRLLARFHTSPRDDEVVANLRRLVGAHPAPGDEDFSICFAPPELRPPDAEVRQRVVAQLPVVQKWMQAAGLANTAWAEAIITHESGGDPEAISPTGCVGLAAICENTEGAPRCCAHDHGDGYRSIYDLCNSERADGYRCDRARDTRFDPEVAARYLVDRLQSVNATIARLQRRGVPLVPEWVVPMAYNAGLGCFSRFPARLRSLPSIMSQLEFDHGHYPEWNRRSLANKVIEIYDYLRWFPYLVEYWEDEARVTSTRADASEGEGPRDLLCFHHSPSAQHRFTSYAATSLAAILIPQVLHPIRVRRLVIGRYEEAQAYYSEGAWLN
jgi:hypothetical protein